MRKSLRTVLGSAVLSSALLLSGTGSAHAATGAYNQCSAWPYQVTVLKNSQCLWHANEDYYLGKNMNNNNDWILRNGDYILVLQKDGNLVEYHLSHFGSDTNIDRVVWASATDGTKTGWLAMQKDGNLVLYDADSNSKWSTGTYTWNDSSAWLFLENAGGLAVAGENNNFAWISQKS